MGGQILRYYLKIISFFFIFVIYFIFIIFFKNIETKNNYLIIEKNQNSLNIIENNIVDNQINLTIYNLLLKFLISQNFNFHYGKFKLKNNNFFSFIKTISNPSNVLDKITIVEGWSKKDLNNILVGNFNNYISLNYNEVLADTYFFNFGSSFYDFKKKILEHFNSYKKKYKNNELLSLYTFEELLIIGSLLEKEGINNKDKKKIFSVIINRINKNMKLQIDATVIYALTDGERELNRKLNYNDLKINHEYNTYYNYGLPPQPISYVGSKTIDLIFENYKSDYLFYFYNSIEKKHIYSINYKNHLKKLNEYRSKK